MIRREDLERVDRLKDTHPMKDAVKRDILTVEHIKKLHEEIDMLRKQKMYLQSKLREKNVKEGKKEEA
jgi:hypothetical protein